MVRSTGIVSLFVKVAAGEMTADEAADEMMRLRPKSWPERLSIWIEKKLSEMHRKIRPGT